MQIEIKAALLQQKWGNLNFARGMIAQILAVLTKYSSQLVLASFMA